MATETEAKFALPSHQNVRRRLGEAGGQYLGRVIETNTIHDRRDDASPAGRLRRAGAALRVRSLEILDGPAQPATVTFKGPVQPGAFKSREELELPIADADGMRRLLDGIGFTQVMCFRKRRESWRMGGCRVELDELPRLGCFVEIEGADEAAIQRVRESLGLTDAQPVAATYLSLVAEAFANEIAAGQTADFD